MLGCSIVDVNKFCKCMSFQLLVITVSELLSPIMIIRLVAHSLFSNTEVNNSLIGCGNCVAPERLAILYINFILVGLAIL
jgi:hypothetical protein